MYLIVIYTYELTGITYTSKRTNSIERLKDVFETCTSD